MKKNKIYQTEEGLMSNTSLSMEISFSPSQTIIVIPKDLTSTLSSTKNDSTRIFFLYQTLGTHGGIDMEYFKTGDQHYLAVANFENGTSYRLNSVIYQWSVSQEQFVVFQSIETFGAHSFDFFEITNEQFLAISNYYDGSSHSINSSIYKWKSNKFEKIQDIATEGAVDAETFAISNETFLAFANHYTQQKRVLVQSAMFKWSAQQFVKLQSFQTYGARDVKSFTDNGSTLLAFANYQRESQYDINSPIYKWNGSHFVKLFWVYYVSGISSFSGTVH